MTDVSAFDSRLLLQEGDEVEVTLRGTVFSSDIFQGEFRVRVAPGKTLGSQLLKNATSVKILKRPLKFETGAIYQDPNTRVCWQRVGTTFHGFDGAVLDDTFHGHDEFRARLVRVTLPSEVDTDQGFISKTFRAVLTNDGT